MSAPDYDHVDDDGEDVQLISGGTSSRNDDYNSIIDQCINASENNGNLMALYTFSLAMVIISYYQ
jgi:hypothetical protein